MTHIVFFDVLWRRVEMYLVMTSAPADGLDYEIKCWIVHHITEPVLEVMYRIGLTTHKPMIAYTAEDLLEDVELDRGES